MAGNASAVPYETFGPYYLRRAIEGNRSGEVKRLLEYGVSPRHVMFDPGYVPGTKTTGAAAGAVKNCGTCRTVLMDAAQRGLTSVVRLLSRFGADVNFGDAGGRTALHYAAYGGDVGSLEALLSRGGDVNRRTRDGMSVFEVAEKAERRAMMQFIGRRREFIGERRMLGGNGRGNGRGGSHVHDGNEAIKVDVIEGNEVLKSAEVSKEQHGPRAVPIKRPSKEVQDSGRSSSSSSSSASSSSSLSSPSSSSSSSNRNRKKKPRHRHRNARSFRQLRLAVARNDARRARHLLQRGDTTPDAGYWNGKIESTLLMEAALGKKERLTELLLVYGANPNAKTKIKAKTPLHYAATGGDVRVIQILVAYGADMGARDAHGWTALHFAAYWNRYYNLGI